MINEEFNSGALPKVMCFNLTEKRPKADCVVVIDVLRACTTAAYAFAAGAEKVVMVSTIEEAFAYKKFFSNALIMGEVGGQPVPGFDFGNSPYEISKFNLQNKVLIQRTSSGTQGVVSTRTTENVLVCGFVNAAATLRRIKKLNPKILHFIITGSRDGSEDRALADYLIASLKNEQINPYSYLQQVRDSPEGKAFFHYSSAHRPKEDLDFACDIDKFSFVMEVKHDGAMYVITSSEEM